MVGHSFCVGFLLLSLSLGIEINVHGSKRIRERERDEKRERGNKSDIVWDNNGDDDNARARALTKSHNHRRARRKKLCMQTRYSIRIANKAQLLKDVNGDSRLEKFPLFFLRLHKWLSCAHDSYLANPFDNITYFVCAVAAAAADFCWLWVRSGAHFDQWFARFELGICFGRFDCHFTHTHTHTNYNWILLISVYVCALKRFYELKYASHVHVTERNLYENLYEHNKPTVA